MATGARGRFLYESDCKDKNFILYLPKLFRSFFVLMLKTKTRFLRSLQSTIRCLIYLFSLVYPFRSILFMCAILRMRTRVQKAYISLSINGLNQKREIRIVRANACPHYAIILALIAESTMNKGMEVSLLLGKIFPINREQIPIICGNTFPQYVGPPELTDLFTFYSFLRLSLRKGKNV